MSVDFDPLAVHLVKVVGKASSLRVLHLNIRNTLLLAPLNFKRNVLLNNKMGFEKTWSKISLRTNTKRTKKRVI